MKLTTIISNTIKNGLRTVKSFTIGPNRETADYVSPGGFDFNPPSGMKPIFAKTENSNEPICIGYLLKNALSDLAEGDAAMFSTNGKDIYAFIKSRVDGNIEINGNEDFAVRYNKLKEEYDKTKDVNDTILSIINGAPIAEPGNGSPSAFQAALAAALSGKQTGDIAASKVDNVKLP